MSETITLANGRTFPVISSTPNGKRKELARDYASHRRCKTWMERVQ